MWLNWPERVRLPWRAAAKVPDMPIDLLVSSFVTLFVIVDPIGTAAVFAGLSRNLSYAKTRRTALTAITVSTLAMIVMAFIGEWLLEAVGITMPALRIAGGLLLFVTAYRMVMLGESAESGGVTEERSQDIAIFPLAIPLLAGPGCITATILIANRSAEAGYPLITLIAILAVQATALLCLLGAVQLMKVLGSGLVQVIARLLGILLAALSIQFIADGIRQIAA